MAASFENRKALRFVVTLGTGKFGSSDNDQITLQGFRAIADIDKAGGVQMGTLRAKIYGVSQSDMNSITSFTMQAPVNGGYHYRPNTVEVYAIDGGVETVVFAGNIVNAWADYQGMPDVYLHIQAQAAFFNQLKPVPPRSFKGGVDVASIMGQIARDMGYTFENNGVTVKLSDVYLANTGLEQAKELAQAAGIGFYIDDTVLAITPSRTTPRGGITPLISPASGLVGYPTFDGWGVNIQCLFNPAVTFGGRIKLETDVLRASGEWLVASIAHRLESEKPGGAWFTTIRGNQTGLAVTGR
jgi:hypothetical protein